MGQQNKWVQVQGGYIVHSYEDGGTEFAQIIQGNLFAHAVILASKHKTFDFLEDAKEWVEKHYKEFSEKCARTPK